MDIHTVRQQMRTNSIYEIPLRVTYYARVSSESDEQLNSLGNQIQYYEQLIRKNSAWTFVPGYVDEGLSGISTKKRENFNRMIDEAAGDRFDLVITKEISRFARNTLDSIQFTRRLLQCGVGVFFQNDNINTLDEDAELRLSIMSSIAQDELRKLSSRVRFGHQQAIRSSVVLGNSNIFGYRKDHKHLAIDEAEAPMVRELFQLYATGDYSLRQLEQLFWDKGYRNRNGNRLSHSTMSNILSNPKYKGYYVGNKVRIVDMFTKKQKFLPQEEWVMHRDESGEVVPAIVPEALWEQANAVLRRRSEDVKTRRGICNHDNLLTGKLYCTCCGAPYYRRESKDRQGRINSRWVCSGKLKNGAGSCPSFAIYESEIKPVLFSVFQGDGVDPEALTEEYLQMYAATSVQDGLPAQLEAAKKAAANAARRKSKLLQLAADGKITDDDFSEMAAQCNQELQAAEATRQALQARLDGGETLQKQLAALRTVLRNARKDAAAGMITKDLITRYIDRIDVTPAGSTLRLDIRLHTGASVGQSLRHGWERTADPVDGSVGHTFKKMIEAYERGMK